MLLEDKIEEIITTIRAMLEQNPEMVDRVLGLLTPLQWGYIPGNSDGFVLLPLKEWYESLWHLSDEVAQKLADHAITPDMIQALSIIDAYDGNFGRKYGLNREEIGEILSHRTYKVAGSSR